jgi:hypothetical protein
MFNLIEQFFNLLERFSKPQTDLERFIQSRNPTHPGEVDNLIRQYTYGNTLWDIFVNFMIFWQVGVKQYTNIVKVAILNITIEEVRWII